jgi:hypothetical protein
VSALDRAIRAKIAQSQNALAGAPTGSPPWIYLDALTAVLDVHASCQFYEGDDACKSCNDTAGNPIEWPSPTVRAIDRALHVEVPGGAG